MLGMLQRLWRMTRPKSRGFAISYACRRSIRAADRVRKSGDWTAAAELYARALQLEPRLAHVHVQHGHALKEAKRVDEALAAYQRATEIDPLSADAHLHLGHAFKVAGQSVDAGRSYLVALDLAENMHGIRREIPWIVQNLPATEDALGRWISNAMNDGAPIARPYPDATGEMPGVAYDVTDLFNYFFSSRLPTGIQRVQMEIFSRAAQSDDSIFVYYMPVKGGWTRLPREGFAHLLTLSAHSADGNDPTWTGVLDQMMATIANRAAIDWQENMVLINLSASMADDRYLDFVIALKREYRASFVVLVYDVIPLMFPYFFPTGLQHDFNRWIHRVAAIADHFVCISECTARDLINKVLANDRLPDVSVLPLDADFSRDRGIGEVPTGLLQGSTSHYILMVSTLEPRKNHLAALDAWEILAERLGPKEVPHLICVGGRGWLNSPVHEKLAGSKFLTDRVQLKSGVTDDELCWLYRNCAFTLYPSFYEGWGLPVTESLCYGKVPASSNAASLPEAGGQFALYFDPDKPAMIADAVVKLLDAHVRTDMEQAIANGFRPRDWRELANRMQDVALQLRARDGDFAKSQESSNDPV